MERPAEILSVLFSEEGCTVRLEVSGDEGLVLVLWGWVFVLKVGSVFPTSLH